ncbi:hypothetical protein JKP88DRAFT_243080 [Tribonema minus]|uniref:Uncharacterized protein n=1 Tax=Tribonema minus TaxID=303371 RepID=A0A835ZFL8_9STRA|nr:hypothetical protein JKP88DRAFT_243080 [Tribonema minus]
MTPINNRFFVTVFEQLAFRGGGQSKLSARLSRQDLRAPPHSCSYTAASNHQHRCHHIGQRAVTTGMTSAAAIALTPPLLAALLLSAQIAIMSDFVENVIDQLAKLVGQIYQRLVDAIGDARLHLLWMLAQAEEHLSEARDTLQRWIMEEVLRDRRNRRRSPFARAYSVSVALFNELPGDAAMPPPIMRDTNKCERVAATVASFAELPGDDTCAPAPVAVLLMDQSGNVTGTIGQFRLKYFQSQQLREKYAEYCARRAAAAIAAAATTAAAAAAPQPLPSPKQHHRRQSSLVQDAVGAVVGLTGAVICAAQQTAGSIVCNTTGAIVNTAGAIAGDTVGAVVNTTGAVVGGVGAITGVVCRFFFGAGRTDKSAEKPQGRGRSATRSLSPKGEGAEEGGREPRSASPSD